MATKALISKLQQVFADVNKSGKSYSKVWLSEIDLGGLYYTDRLILRLKTSYVIDDLFEETRKVFELLKQNAPEEAKYIQRIGVYDVNEKAEPKEDDIIIYEEASAFA